MYRDKKIALVVVAHNEERLIRPTLEKAPEYVDKIFMIDDASTDSTVSLVEERKKIDPRIEIIRHRENQGVGAAIINGYEAAKEGGYDITVVVGGDDQMPMEQMPRLLDPIVDGRADYVKGNRFIEGDDVFARMPRIRVVGNTILSLLTKIASGLYRIFDVVEGYTAISLYALHRVDWSKAWKGYGYPMDFLIRMGAHGLRVLDVPRRAIYTPGERQSQIKGLSYTIKVSPMLFRGFIWRLQHRYLFRDFHPVLLLYIGGAILFLAGFIIGIDIINAKLHGTIPSAATAVICSLCISLGIQSVFFAMLFEMLEDQKKH